MSKSDPESDEVLASRAADGVRAAFEELVERYGGSVVSVIERRLGDHHSALDLAQDVWVRVFRALSRFDATRSFRSWLFSIALNSVRDEGRRRERSPIVHLDEYRELPEARDTSEMLAERSAIEAALELLSEPFRTAVVLVDVEGFAYEEAAESAGCAVGTMKSRVNRGRLAFRDHWLKLTGTRRNDNIDTGKSRDDSTQDRDDSSQDRDELTVGGSS